MIRINKDYRCCVKNAKVNDRWRVVPRKGTRRWASLPPVPFVTQHWFQQEKGPRFVTRVCNRQRCFVCTAVRNLASEHELHTNLKLHTCRQSIELNSHWKKTKQKRVPSHEFAVKSFRLVTQLILLAGRSGFLKDHCTLRQYSLFLCWLAFCRGLSIVCGYLTT